MLEALKRQGQNTQASKYDFTPYQGRPLDFLTEVLKAKLYPDLVDLVKAFQESPVVEGRSANGVGKTFTMAHLCVYFFLVYPDAKVFTTAAPPVDNLKNLLWGEIWAITERFPHLFEGLKFNTLRISRGKNSFLTGIAIPTTGTPENREAKFSGKHAPNMMFAVDEGDAVPDEVYKGIDSCMSGGNARLFIAFNPRAKLGPVWRKERDKQAKVVSLSALRHPNVLDGENHVPGAVDRNKTVRRILEWTRPLVEGEKADDYTFTPPDFLVGFEALADDGRLLPPLQAGARKIENPEFSYKVLGEYPFQSEHQLISEEWVDRAQSNWKLYQAKHGDIPPEGVAPRLGLDVAEYGEDSNVLTARYGSYVAMPHPFGGMDIDETALYALKEYYRLRGRIIYIDALGIGSGVAPRMVREDRRNHILGKRNGDYIKSLPIKVSNSPTPGIESEHGEFYSLRDQLWWSVREWLRKNENAMLPPHELLREDLLSIQYEHRQRDGTIKITDKDDLRKMLRRSTDYGDSLALTFFPFEGAKVVRIHSSEGD